MTREEKQKAIDALKISAPVITVTQEEFYGYIQTLNKIMDWIKQEPCEDCVSRDAVRKLFKEWMDDGEEYAPHVFKELVEALPPVTPQQNVGRWITKWAECGTAECGTYEYMCSECNCIEYMDLNYCPNCGSRMMQEVEE